jgi:hypothetical protein
VAGTADIVAEVMGEQIQAIRVAAAEKRDTNSDKIGKTRQR